MGFGIIIKTTPDGKTKIEYGSKKKKREDKGKSLLEIPSNYTIIDIETTGLDSSFDDIIELGAIRIRNNEIVKIYNSLIQPYYEIDKYIESLTGITNEMVADAPTIDKKINEFIDFLGDDVLVGHNINFDINFIYDKAIEFYKRPITNDFVDTLRLSKWCIKDTPDYKLSTLANRFSIDTANEHRASVDCIITYELLKNLKIIIDNNPNIFDSLKKSYTLKAKDIHANIEQINSDNPFYNKVVVFTGTLENFLRKDAMQIVANLGGINADNVTKKTNYLVLGNTDYSRVKDGKSNKQKKAETLKLKGQEIEIISENVFCDMIDDNLTND